MLVIIFYIINTILIIKKLYIFIVLFSYVRGKQ